jgi:hypothetical protein
MKTRKLNSKGWLFIIALGLLIAGGIMRSQVQVSGGSAVTQSGTWTVQPGNTVNTTAWKVDGSAVTQPVSGNVGQSGTWTVQPGNTANTTAWKVDGSAVTQPVSGTLTAVTAITNALPAGTNVIGHVITDSGLINIIPKTACGNTLATGSTLAAVPTSSTLLTSAATACGIAAAFYNTNATAQTVTLTDNTATPINAVLTFSIPGNSNLIQPLYGGAFNLGIKWSAGGTGVTGYVVAYQ